MIIYIFLSKNFYNYKMQEIVYPKNYYKYPLEYHFNPDLYGSYVKNPNMCNPQFPAKDPFGPDPDERGDLCKCRDNIQLKCQQKPFYGGDPTSSFPNGLKYQDLPYFNPPVNKYGMLTLGRPKNYEKYNYNAYHGY